ncbi:hypothetical protein, partial [Azospirillum rugosum]|uniref:hypothetical protein n=1 Tax=Azospirillum rugosum TaxID=416170 RepID=UPI00362133FE
MTTTTMPLPASFMAMRRFCTMLHIGCVDLPNGWMAAGGLRPAFPHWPLAQSGENEQAVRSKLNSAYGG